MASLFGHALVAYTAMINQNGKFLQLTLELKFSASFINPKNYPFFKEFFTQTVEKQSEKVVLKRI